MIHTILIFPLNGDVPDKYDDEHFTIEIVWTEYQLTSLFRISNDPKPVNSWQNLYKNSSQSHTQFFHLVVVFTWIKASYERDAFFPQKLWLGNVSSLLFPTCLESTLTFFLNFRRQVTWIYKSFSQRQPWIHLNSIFNTEKKGWIQESRNFFLL